MSARFGVSDGNALCEAPIVGSRTRKCGRCSRGGHVCENDPSPVHLQLAVRHAAVNGGDVAAPLRAWEGKVILNRSARIWLMMIAALRTIRYALEAEWSDEVVPFDSLNVTHDRPSMAQNLENKSKCQESCTYYIDPYASACS